MKLLSPLRWRTSTTAGPSALPPTPLRAPIRATFTTPPDPRWASYQSVVTTAHPSALAFR